MKRVRKKLLDISTDAFVLSMEIFNKPAIRYKLEGLGVDFELVEKRLLKAKTSNHVDY